MNQMTRRGTILAGAAMASGAAAAQTPDPFAAIPPALQQMVKVGGLPGVVTLTWRKGQVVQANAVGVRNIERNLPMQRDTIFGIASMTKPITVVAALTLLEQGKLKLDDPISKWAPEFANMRVLRKPDGPLDDTYPAPRAITIEDLMTHRSGLSYGFLSQGPLAAALTAAVGMGIESDLTPDTWMKALAALPLAYAPGERFNYGHSMDVLGFIVGRAAKSSLRQVMMERIFAPLKMVDTDFWVPPVKRDRAAAIYMSPALNSFSPLVIAGFVGAKPPAYTSGGQGLVSTADDYLTFARMLMGGGQVNGRRVLKPETVKLMTTNRLAPAQRLIPASALGISWKNEGFGLGMYVVTDGEAYSAAPAAASTGAYGWPGMFGGYWQADPAQDLIFIWLQEVLPAPPAPGVIPRMPGSGGLAQFQKLTYAALKT